MRLVVILLALGLATVLPAAEPESEDTFERQYDSFQVKVSDPYVEVHTGPGRGYPVFHVVEQFQRLATVFIQIHTQNGEAIVPVFTVQVVQ